MAAPQPADRFADYRARRDRALDELPALECHCLCLLWREYPKTTIARLTGTTESEVDAAMERAVRHLVSRLS